MPASVLAQGLELGCIRGPELQAGAFVDLGHGGGGGRHWASARHVTHTHAVRHAGSAHVVPHHASPGMHLVHLGHVPDARAEIADAHDLPFADASFDDVLVFHTLTYAERPNRVLAECARVLRPGGRLVVLCLDEHRQSEVTLDDRARRALFRQMQTLLAEDAPVVWLYVHPRLAVARKGVEGVWKDLPAFSLDLSEVTWTR